MAKSTHNRTEKPSMQKKAGQSFIAVDKNAFDPTLSSLFEKSSGPVTAPPKSRYQNLPERKPVEDSSDEEEEEDQHEQDADSSNEQEESSVESEGDLDLDEESDASPEEPSADSDDASDHEVVLSKVRESILNGEQNRPEKKRKRANKEEEVEDTYMRKLVREQEKEEEQRRKKQKTEAVENEGDNSTQSEESDGDELTIPKHETQMDAADGNADELEKASRTVFLGNVSSEAITSKSAKKTLLRHLGSFIPDMADHIPPHKVESIRFRSTAFASAVPKRAAFAKKEVMDATTKSTNAYAVYSTQLAANKAAKQLNGTVVLDRHLRVDSLAHPAKVDHRRCVFVGNLGFVDDESTVEPKDGEKKKNKPPSDVEEGLWTQFSKAGKVESVRVVRDAKTRVGKGIAYVQFEDENGVEAALQFNEQKYPPLLPRKLRVVRAKAPKKAKKPNSVPSKPTSDKKKGAYNAKITEEQKTSQGRAKAMLGKAGAFKTAESFVFEGHRASSKQGNSGLKLGGKKKGKGKLSNRSAKRAAAWKKSGGKK